MAQTIQQALPNTQVLYADDHENIPYGSRPPKEVKAFVLPILEALQAEGCQAIVIACNTVTTTLITELRKIIKVPLVGMEPMIKPASAQTKTKKIAVCATPATLASERYRWLKNEFAAGIKVFEPDCSDWSYMIQNKQTDHQKIDSRIREVCRQGADVIVLGCTHYHWIEEDIQKIADEFSAKVIQPEQAIVSRLKTVLSQLS